MKTWLSLQLCVVFTFFQKLTSQYTWDVEGRQAWVEPYVKFHRENRLTARRLILDCPPEFPGFGLGDRIRGVLYSTRVAAANELILAINWTDNFDLTGKLQPAEINWLPDFEDTGSRDSMVVPADTYEALANALVNSKADLYFCTHEAVMADGGAYRDIITKGWNFPGLEANRLTWSKLFKPTAALRDEYEAARMRIFNTTITNFEYVGVHLRIGNLVGEGVDIVRTKKCNLLAQLASESCARDMADEHIPQEEGWPVLLITDNSVLRWGISEHLFDRVVGPSTMAQHSGNTKGLDLMNEYVDLMLLANAKCYVYSDSGFSNLALWWGNHTCIMSISDCIDRKQSLADAPDCR